MSNLLDDIEEATEVVVPEVVKPMAKAGLGTKDERAMEVLRQKEDELLAENMAIIRDAAKFRDIDPESDEIPMEWIAEVGLVEARKRFRMARAAWMNAKTAPVGLAIAQRVMNGIIKARATEKGEPRSLNIAVAVNMPLPQLKVVEVDE